MNLRPIVILLAVVLSPVLCLAHPGHGETPPQAWSHYLVEPIHSVVIALAVLLVAPLAIGWWSARERRGRRP